MSGLVKQWQQHSWVVCLEYHRRGKQRQFGFDGTDSCVVNTPFSHTLHSSKLVINGIGGHDEFSISVLCFELFKEIEVEHRLADTSRASNCNVALTSIHCSTL